MIKFYARQVPPEHQTSPLDYWSSRNGLDLSEPWPEITLTGNGRLRGYETELFQAAERWEKAADEYINGEEWTGAPATIREALENFWIEKQNGKRWTPRELGQWKRLFQDWDRNPWRDEDARTAEALELMTGRPWDYEELNGCSQGDFIIAFYPKDKYSRKDLEILEIEYFNMGEEWTIYDGDPDDPETDCFSVYVYSWDEDEQRRELASAAGCSPEEIKMQRFAGWSKNPIYA